jgi:dihydropteroate synthase
LNARIIKISSPILLDRIKHKYSIVDSFENKCHAIELTDINQTFSEIIFSLVSDIGAGKAYLKNNNNDSCSLLLPISLDNFEVSKEIFENSESMHLYNTIHNAIDNYLNYDNNNLHLNGKEFSLNRSYVMGILNVTPDSFSDGGKYFSVPEAVEYAVNMIEEGTDIIDVGGESTRPGAETISIDEELSRVIPVIEKIRKENPEILISVDTTKSKVADEALCSGANIVNDISGLTFDLGMADVVKKHDAGLVLMHIKGNPQTMQQNPYYEDVVCEVYDFLSNQIKYLKKNGIKNIFIDPGIGFGKRLEDNFELINRLEEFKSLGFPILMGVSKKSFLGKSLNLDINNRENATIAAESICMNNGARIIRTHNVKKAVEAVNIFNLTNSFGKLVNA